MRRARRCRIAVDIAQAGVLPADVSVQAPPNLSPGQLGRLIERVRLGGVSPVTPDYVNPEAPWPSLSALRAATAEQNKHLLARLTVYLVSGHPSGWIGKSDACTWWADAEGWCAMTPGERGLSSRSLRLPLREWIPR